MKEEQKKMGSSKKKHERMLIFSTADDSSLERNEHLLCFVKFSSQERTFQLSLLFSDSPHSTGSGGAHFIFNKLVERPAPFEKLVSVCTDGATNMFGGNIGVTTF